MEQPEQKVDIIQENASKTEIVEVIQETVVEKNGEDQKDEVSNLEKHETYAEVVAHGVENEQETAVEETVNKKETVKEEAVIPEIKEITKDENLHNITPQLMDESIISVPESVDETIPSKDATFSPEPKGQTVKDTTFSPVPKNTSALAVKDSTFSPIADKSIQDCRPHIDNIETEFNTTPLPRNITHRTSTPLAQKIMKRDTPKVGTSAMSSLARVFSPKLPANVVEALNDTVNGQFKLVNPLERSILKSTRKRSLSVTDGESFVQKKVMFISPKVMDIGEIDERMMQSFREEKEISMKAQVVASGTRRKRSLSASETPIAKSKKHMPDFKAIHQAQFKKMESIEEHKARKAERAKRLITPSKSLPGAPASQATSQQQQPVKVAAASKIPKSSRQPLVTKPQTDNAQVSRPLKRSASAEPQTTQIKKPSFVPTLSRAMSQETVKPKLKFPTIKSKSQTSVLQERREKNMSLYKTNVTRTGTADIRKKNESILKGVRLNRRFELMMQNRMAHESSEHADD